MKEKHENLLTNLLELYLIILIQINITYHPVIELNNFYLTIKIVIQNLSNKHLCNFHL